MSRETLVLAVVSVLFALAFGAAVRGFSPGTVAAASADAPAYAANGDLLPPTNYREWTYLTSGIDMSYSPKARDVQDHSMFDNVFVNPAAYRSFLATGSWPDKTVLVLEVREARNKGSINQNGHFQGGLMDFEVHVKDEARFPGKWAFFSFDSPAGKGNADSARRALLHLSQRPRSRRYDVYPVLPYSFAHRAKEGDVERGLRQGRGRIRCSQVTVAFGDFYSLSSTMPMRDSKKMRTRHAGSIGWLFLVSPPRGAAAGNTH